MADEIKCKRCGERRAAVGFAPYPNELGRQISAEICSVCWREWLQKQQMLINHYGLNLIDPDAQTFLLDNAKGFFFGGGQDLAQIDTSKEGTVEW